MNNMFFNWCHPFLNKLSEGATIKLGFRIFLYILGVLALLGGLANLYGALTNFMADYFFFSIGMLFASWIALQVCWFRAQSIANVPNSKYVVSAIFAIFLRANGEIWATYLAVGGVTGALIKGFPGGPLAIVIGPVVGFVVITLFYFFAERLGALPEIAVNTKKD